MPNESFQFVAEDEEATSRFGSLLADAVAPGTCIALVGQLGAGKTRLVQAIAAALGANRSSVNSPTFILLQQYEGRVPVYHLDTYRLRDSDEFLELGIEELFEASEGIYLIEWADRVADVLPLDRLTIRIEVTSADSRKFCVEVGGHKSQQVVDAIRVKLNR